MRHVAFAALAVFGLALGLVPVMVDAQIVPAGAHAPNVINTANGLPQVNISRPSGAGVSLNTYSQFDVNQKGAILNNSPTITNTQLAGQISGNPNLSPGQAARIIVNQVNSSNPSRLAGYVEVAGQKAATVVLANSSGIVVDGGGFINTSRGILTTGNPLIDGNGNLTGFNVTQGNITVQGAGLNASNIDEVDLLARAVELNDAAIYGNNLHVVTGSNSIDYASLTPTPIAGTGPTPGVSIDVSQLGGMYANSITLVGTENGVGVANAGTIASQAGALTLTSAGQLVQSGRMNSSGGNITINAAGVHNSGTIYSAQATTLGTSGAFVNGGTVASQQDTAVNAGSVSSTGVLGAGINSDGSTGPSGNLSISAAGLLSAHGQTIAAGSVSLYGVTLDLSNAQVSAGSTLALLASGGNLGLSGANATAGSSFSASAAGTLDSSNAKLTSGTAMQLSGAQITNTGGQAVAGTTLNVQTAGTLGNQQGTLQAAGAESVSAGSVENGGGQILSLNGDGLTVTTSGLLDNGAGGQIGGNGSVTLQGGQIANAGSVTAVQTLIARAAQTLFNSSTMAANGAMTLAAGTTLTNTAGLTSGGLFTLSAATFNNSGGDASANQFSLNATNFVNHAGTVTQTGTGPMTVNVSNLFDNSAGGTFQTNSTDLTLSAATIDNDNGKILHAGNGALALDPGNGSGSVSDVNGQIVSNGQVVAHAGSLNNTSGDIEGKAGLSATVTGEANNTNGKLLSGAALGLASGSFVNDGGTTSANTTASITTGPLSNRNGGNIEAPDLTLNVSGTVDNSGGNVAANQLAVSATDFINQGGTVTQYGTGPMAFNVSGLFNNSAGGTFQTNSVNFTLSPTNVDNDDGSILHAGTGVFVLTPGNGSGSFSNVGGKVISAGTIQAQMGAFNNGSGTFASQQGMTIAVLNGVNNAAGLMRSLGSLALTTGGALANAGGSVQAGTGAAGDASTLQVQAASIDNTHGVLGDLGVGNTSIQGGSQIVNAAGVVTGNGAVSLGASDIQNTQGGQVSGASLGVQAGEIDNSDSQMGTLPGSQGDANITATGTITNTNGQMGATHDLNLSASTLLGGGTYSAANDVAVNLQGDFTTTPDQQFDAGHNLTFTLPGTFTNGAIVQAANDLGVNAGDIVNSGAMMAGGTLSTHSATLTNTGAMVGGSVSLNATSTLSNLGPTALIGASDSSGTLELLAPDIENRDDTTATDSQATTAIFGLGSVVLAGGKNPDGSYSNANIINNVSALIQSSADMALYANQVTNTRRVMTTSGYTQPVDPSVLAQLGISLSGCTAIDMTACGPGHPYVGWASADNPAFLNMPGGVFTLPPSGGQWNSGYQYTTYTGTALESIITAISPSAQIISGGNLELSKVGLLQNYWSQVAAVGNLAAPVSLDMDSWQGQVAPGIQVTYSGYYHYTNYDHSIGDWTLPFGDAPFSGSNPGGYTQAAPATFQVYGLPDYESSFGAGGTISGTGISINNTAGNAGIPTLNLAPGQSVAGVGIGTISGSTGGTTAGTGPVKGGGGSVDPAIASATAQNVLDNLTVPQGGLFHPDTAPNAPYLIETNSAFTSTNSFLSSNYYLQQLGLNPQSVEKRLGDGLYEQQLVQNQITSLTGKAVLGPYTNTQSMYEALMASGASLAQSLDLPLGMGLSAAQVAALTSNVVIMQTEVVDGQSVLVPVVYLAPSSQQAMNGPLITATNIDIQNAQTFTNSGTVQAGNSLSFSGQQINDAFGTLKSGGLMSLNMAGNIDFTSANVSAGSLALNAGGNLLLNTATNTVNQVSATGATRTTTTLGPIANLNVAGNAAIITGGNFEQNGSNLNVGGNLGMAIGGNYDIGSVQTGEQKVVQRANGVSNTNLNVANGSSVNVGGVSQIGVGGNLTATGANINLSGGGTVLAKGDVTLQAATTTSTFDSNDSGSDHHGSYVQTTHLSDQTLNGTTLNSGNTLNVLSGGNINVMGSSIILNQGNANLAAAGDVNIGAATATQVSNTQEQHSHSNMVSGTQEASSRDTTITQSQGSMISADGVSVASGHNINVNGSAIVGTNSVALGAANDVNISTSQDTMQSSGTYQEKHTGLGTSGLTVTAGTSKVTSTDQESSVTNNASVIGSSTGNVSITAGHNVGITGSEVVAGGNVALTGQNVTVNSAYDTYNENQSQQYSQSGLSVGLGGGVVGLGQSMASAVNQGVQSGDSRLAAVQGVAAAEMAYQNRGALAGAAGALANGDVDAATQGLQLQVSIGSSHSSSNSSTSTTTAKGSSIIGNGNVSVNATGNGQAGTGDISMTGATVMGKNVALDANNAITLQSAQSTEQDSSSNSSGGWSAGAAIGIGGNTTGVTVSASVNNSHGQGNGASVTQDNTTVTAGNTLSMKSGGNTTLSGAQVSGNAVNVDVGGNLTMTSLQDTSTYGGNQHSAGGGVSIGISPGTPTLITPQASISHTGIDSNYASVNQQTGIVAGTGGFDVNVGGHTQLNGAEIASAAPAADNSLTTGSLGFSNVQNSMSYSGSTQGFSLSGGPSFAQTGDSASGVTHAAVSPATITVKSDQQSGADSTAGLSRDTANANQTVQNTFNLQQVQNNLAFAQAFGKTATYVVGQIADQLENNNPAFAEGGVARDALHAAVAAIGAALSGGNIAGAVGGSLAGDALQSLAQPIIEQAVAKVPAEDQTAMRNALNEIVATAGGAAGGALAGGGASGGAIAGAGSASNNEVYNRQLDQSEKQVIKNLANGNPAEEHRLEAAACALVQCAAQYAPGTADYAKYSALQAEGAGYTGEQAQLQNYSGTFSSAGTYGGMVQQTSSGSLFHYSSSDAQADQTAMLSAMGAQRPGSVDYLTVQGGGLGIGGALTINLHNGNVYLSGSGSVPVVPGASIVGGMVASNAGLPMNMRGNNTDDFLAGASAAGGVCAFGICGGVNHGIGGDTAFEVGVGTGGISKLPNLSGYFGTGYGNRVGTMPGY